MCLVAVRNAGNEPQRLNAAVRVRAMALLAVRRCAVAAAPRLGWPAMARRLRQAAGGGPVATTEALCGSGSAAKGGRDITGCLELAGLLIASDGYTDASLYFYQVLHAMGVFPVSAPATVRVFGAPGQRGIEQVVDGYGIECRGVRDLLVDYLRERQAAIDHSTMRSLARQLGKLFWRDLELHHPGISSLRLEPAVAAAWKQRIMTRQATAADRPARTPPRQAAAPRRGQPPGHGAGLLPGHRRMGDGRPRPLGPVGRPLPGAGRGGIPQEEPLPPQVPHGRPHPRADARPARPGRRRRPGAQDGCRSAGRGSRRGPRAVRSPSPGRSCSARRPAATRAGEPGRRTRPPAGRRDLTLEEEHAFWAWAAVEVLRHTGIRIEELTELSHHSLIQYRLPATGELVPLLQIAPSKTDAERLLVISPELADVLSAVVSRVRGPAGAIPLVTSYDPHERTWNPPMPLLFQRQHGMENRGIGAQAVRELLDGALASAGLAGEDGLAAEVHPARLPQDLRDRRRDERHAAAHRPAHLRPRQHQHHHGLQGRLPRGSHHRLPGIHRPPPRQQARRGIPDPHRRRMGRVPRPLRAAQGRPLGNVRPRDVERGPSRECGACLSRVLAG